MARVGVVNRNRKKSHDDQVSDKVREDREHEGFERKARYGQAQSARDDHEHFGACFNALLSGGCWPGG